MPKVEVFTGAFVTVVLEKLTAYDLRKLVGSKGIDSKLKKWEITLSQIRVVLGDAEQKQVTHQVVHGWLKNLQDLAYDIDDVLDDLSTEALRRKSIIESEAGTSNSSKVLKKLIPTCFTSFTPRNFMYGREMSSKLDDITERLQHLLSIEIGLGLSVNVEKQPVSRGEETSQLDAAGVVGRDGDKEILLEKLLQEETCDLNVSVVPIVGMGGIGKTTLARLLYNDKKVKDHFELRVWVGVSEEFDIFKISKIIFQAVAGEKGDFENLELLQASLEEKLSKKRFLLVLDDVWNEDPRKWEQLQRPLHVGAPGSKIILTTRSLEAVSTVPGAQAYHIQLLSDGESLSLLAQHALGKRNFDAHPELESHGKGIVRKCKCLPLALRTLGSVLYSKSNEEEWEEILNSDIWSSQKVKSQVLPALRLSYHHLPLHLKQLFAYCSLFPKDYVFEKDELVFLWMAEGFLPKSNEEKPMEEDVGAQYFKELLERSFFQPSPNEDSRYIMHDLINDLAKYVAGKFFLRSDEKVNGVERNEALEQIRHFSFLRQRHEVYRKFEALHGAKRLRTFLPVSVNPRGREWFYLSNQVLVDLLPQLQFLRVLSLSRYRSIREVPNSICELKHLRYLNFSYTRITCLPERVCQLYNLQTLLMHGCEELEKLPVNIAKLINLRHLDISNTPKLKTMPSGIGGLTSIQTLSKVIVEGDDGFKITELKGLKALRGRLSIKGLHKVVNEIHAKEASLLQKKGLEHLELEWSDEFDDSHMETTKYGILKSLEPHRNLRKLEIVCYRGNEFPNWIGDPSFAGLTELTLRGCKNCTSLPPVGHLPSLQKLFVGGMDALKTVGPEILGISSSSPVIVFPSLEVLEFKNMQGWEKWLINGDVNDETAGVFPCLHKLIIQDCPSLAEVSIQSLQSLRVLCIDRCQEVVLRSVVEVTQRIRELTIKEVVGLSQLDRRMMGHLGAMEDLDVRHCKEVRYLWGSLAQACKILVKLRKLEVDDCGELVCLGEKEEGGHWSQGNSLTSLRELKVSSCRKMECLFGKGIEEEEESWGSSIFPHLESLSIYKCSGMKSLFSTGGGGGQQLPSTLKRLQIEYCDNLLSEESVVVGGKNHDSTLSSLVSLEYLSIWSWPIAKSFLEGRFIHLTQLRIYDCEGIDWFPKVTTTTGGGGGFLPKGLRILEICNCMNLKSFPDEELQTLTSLEALTIKNCPSMDPAFPHGLWPPSLSILCLGGLKKPIAEWGPQNFPNSLVYLSLAGDESIAELVGSSSSSTPTTTALHLPTSLSELLLRDFKNLESISKGLQHLTSLKTLNLVGCPNLSDLPLRLPSLSYLGIWKCPKLKERCIRTTRRDSSHPLLSIPRVVIDNKDLFVSSQ